MFVQVGKADGQPVTAIRFCPQYPHIAFICTSGGNVLYSDVSRPDQLTSSVINEPGNALSALDFAFDGSRFYTAGSDSVIRMFDTESFQTLHRLRSGRRDQSEQLEGGHTSRVFALKTHSEVSFLLFSGGWDGTVRLWDTRLRDPLVRLFHGPQLCGADAIDYVSGALLTGSWRVADALELWDVGSGRRIAALSSRAGASASASVSSAIQSNQAADMSPDGGHSHPTKSAHPSIIHNHASPESATSTATPSSTAALQYLYCARLVEGTRSALAAGSGRGGGLVLADLSNANTTSTSEAGHSQAPDGAIEDDATIIGRAEFPQPSFALDFEHASGIAVVGGASTSILLASVL